MKAFFSLHSLLVPLFVVNVLHAQHPFKYDSGIYRTVYLQDAVSMMDSLQNFLLIDVRTPGEFRDTSRATALNIGRLKGAVHITVDSVPARLTELRKYKNEPIFIYCSHSQRSRRMSKLLVENGFQKIYNINGGLTLLNEADAREFPFKDSMLLTSLDYTHIASVQALDLIKAGRNLVIIDIRTGREFNSKDSVQRNNIGRLKNALNIPQSAFAERTARIGYPQNTVFLVYDQFGYNSMDVIPILRMKGYTKIYNLFGGLNALIADHKVNPELIRDFMADAPTYIPVDAASCIQLLNSEPDLLILDTRPLSEFDNRDSLSYRNLGIIRGAVHLSSPDSLNIFLRSRKKTEPVLVYGSNSDLGVLTCLRLRKEGYTQVFYLQKGFYDLVWSAANVKECRDGRQWLTRHEGLY